MKKILSALIVSSLLLLATTVEETQNLYRNDTSTNPSPKVTTTYQNATGSQSTKNWNQQDWKKHFSDNGRLDSGLIGSSQNSLKSAGGTDVALDANPNTINSTNLRKDTSLSGVKSLHSFSDELQKSVMDTNVSSSKTLVNLDQTTKCYITREMPVRYKCDKTGLVYGGGINSSGAEAKTTCESECYEQFSCADVSPTSQITQENWGGFTVNAAQEQTKSRGTIAKIDAINLSAEVNAGKVYLDIILTTKDGKEKYFTRKMSITTKEYSIKLNQDATILKLVAYGGDGTAVGNINNIVVSYKKENKFICPSSQDLSDKSPGNFAYLCPSGKIKTFSTNGRTYKICEDSGIVGDNSDGTFSNQTSCTNICKNNYSCGLDTVSVGTNSLQNFREGCIEGQSNCSTDTCRQLRISQNQVLNENVFYGDFVSHPTVVSGITVKGAERPKILLQEDVDFATRSKEEWKDGAYSDMVKKGTYRVSAMKINENTTESNAYNMGMVTNSVDTTISGSAIRSIYWVLKPKAFDVNTSTEFKNYAIVEATVDSLKYDTYGKKIRAKDKILYVKTSEDDTFKAFAIKRDFAKKDYYGVEDSPNVAAYWSYEYFNSSLKNWYPLNSSNLLEYFKKSPIAFIELPYLRIPIVENNNSLMYNLGGIIRSKVTNGPIDTLNYTGDFNGTGQVISQIKVYTKYTQETYTYLDAITKIDNGDWTPIYNNTSSSASPQNVTSDTQVVSDSLTMKNQKTKQSNEDIEIFLYGNESNKTAYTRIKPKEEDIGKKAFIFIFAQ